jgi:hypothetical protein
VSAAYAVVTNCSAKLRRRAAATPADEDLLALAVIDSLEPLLDHLEQAR